MNDLTGMQIAFRVDASLDIGTGHVMRCLTLADELRERGVRCSFITRAHLGNLIAYIEQRGFKVQQLNAADYDSRVSSPDEGYAQWLGVKWEVDAIQTLEALNSLGNIDWLVVDHYAIDSRWEEFVSAVARHILVVDDLANRPHHAHILVDQTFSRNKSEYQYLVSPQCKLMCGLEYAILRSDFNVWRPYSLNRRSHKISKILVSLGGVDKENVTAQVLLALQAPVKDFDIDVTVVLGQTSPWIAEITQLIKALPFKADLKISVNNMAELLANSDLVIGAAGSSSWERCLLGVPTLMVVLAENQQEIASQLAKIGAANIISRDNLMQEIGSAIKQFQSSDELLKLSECSARLITMSGVDRLVQMMLKVNA